MKQGGTVGDWFAHLLHSSDPVGSNLGSGVPLWGWHRIPVLVWVFSECSCFLPHHQKKPHTWWMN